VGFTILVDLLHFAGYFSPLEFKIQASTRF